MKPQLGFTLPPKLAMNVKLALVPTTCAICAAPGDASELYPANFSPQDLNPEVFSARRMPDKIHYRLVRCNTCGLVRSDPIINHETMVELYTKSSQTS
jgi:hypothetical protein